MKQDTPESTILVISMGFLILYVVEAWKWTLIVSLVVGIIGISSSRLSKLIESMWMQFAQVLSYIMPSILLGAVFYLVLFPISLISKVFVKDPLMLSNEYPTYFVTIDREIEKQDFEKIW